MRLAAMTLAAIAQLSPTAATSEHRRRRDPVPEVIHSSLDSPEKACRTRP
jgi:hypothetical protein